MSDSDSNHLTFTIPSNGDNDPLKIRVHEDATDDDDQGDAETNTGFVMWPSAVLLSHHISQHPELLQGADTPNGNVMELGAGCGLPGLTAATILQNSDDSSSGSKSDDKVIFTDYNPAVLENLKRNILLNEFDVEHEVYGLDWFHQQPPGSNDDDEDKAGVMKRDDSTWVEREENTWVDTDGTSHGQFRLILGADLIVCSNDADLVAHTLDASLMEGGVAVILGASADRRFGVSDFPNSCRELGMEVEVDENILEAREDGGEQLMEELEMGGYNQRACTFGHDFTMFTINKPMSSS